MRIIKLILLLFSLSIYSQNSFSKLPTIPHTSKADAGLLQLDKAINSRHVEYTPFITPDEKFLYFESNRPGGVGQTGDFDLWVAENLSKAGENPRFAEPANVGSPVNSIFFDGLPSLRLLANGSYEMYFTSFSSEKRPGPEETNIYYTKQVNGKWITPTQVIELNTDFHDRMPSISKDGNFLYFSSNRPGGFGRDDIWVSAYDRQKKRWSKPKNLGSQLNTPAAEVSPSIHSDDITLYLSSDRKEGLGGYDIYVSQKTGLTREGTFSKAQNLGTPYNSKKDDEYPTVPLSGNHMYFTSNRAESLGRFDIFRAKVPYFARPRVVISMHGRVHEINTMKGIEATIEISSDDKRKFLASSLPDGKYQLNFINHNKYNIVVSSPGYEPYDFLLNLTDEHKPVDLVKQIAMTPVLRVPPSISLRIRFNDGAGNRLMPSATYIEDKSIEKIISLTKNEKSFSIPIQLKQSSLKEINQYLENKKIEIRSQLKGYKPNTVKLSLANIIKAENFSFRQVYYAPDITLEKLEQPAEITKIDSPPAIAKSATNDKKVISNIAKIKKNTTLDNINPHELKNPTATLYFNTGVFNKLSVEAKLRLELVIEKWKKNAKLLVIVNGHTDNEGPLLFNTKLSMNRALYVKSLLVKAGIAKKNIQPNWFAYKRPAKTKSKLIAKSLNRRVEIFLHAESQ